MSDHPSLYFAVREFKRRYILDAVLFSHGSRTHAAKLLGINRSYLLKLVRELDIELPPVEPAKTKAV